MSPGSADVVIVGNGVLGLSTAVRLAYREPRARVAVVGPAARERGASAAAGAMLNCFGEVTAHSSGHPAARARFSIARQALEEWPDWLDFLAELAGPEAAGLRASCVEGTVVVLSARLGQVATDNFAAIGAALAEHGEPHEALAAEDVAGLSPEFPARPSRVLYLPREGGVDARAVMAALAAAARRLGVALVHATAERLVVDAHRVRGVRLTGGDTVDTGTVVLAAGSAGSALAQAVLPAGAFPPVLHGTGFALLVEPPRPGPRHVLRTPNRAGSCGLHLVPQRASGTLYAGATNIVTPDPTPGPDIASSHSLMRMLCEQLDHHLAARHVHRWLHGVRPVSVDGFPLIGGCSVEGLLFATGTNRDGFHCSPVIATHLTDTVLGAGASDDRFGWFTPERPPIEPTTLRQAIAEATDHDTDAAHETGLALPYWLDEDQLRTAVHQRVRRLYDNLGTALLPEVVRVLRATVDPTRETFLRDYLRAAHAHHPHPAPTTGADNPDTARHRGAR
ncbi:FAD-binding oxidoreductase [Saccharothrix algeriensis]|uniref:FAD-binding oxidoreductase n=1 Tax=Saccharothrix algeriensis TaxID=173560 RepID=A0A8T8HWX2_9PSEU|nr:FAD-binding oxidoreductase [Saccharothrix algeriensis]